MLPRSPANIYLHSKRLLMAKATLLSTSAGEGQRGFMLTVCCMSPLKAGFSTHRSLTVSPLDAHHHHWEQRFLNKESSCKVHQEWRVCIVKFCEHHGFFKEQRRVTRRRHILWRVSSGNKMQCPVSMTEPVQTRWHSAAFFIKKSNKNAVLYLQRVQLNKEQETRPEMICKSSALEHHHCRHRLWLFVCMAAGLRKYYEAHFHKTWTKGNLLWGKICIFVL